MCVYVFITSFLFVSSYSQNDFFMVQKDDQYYCITNTRYPLSWIDDNAEENISKYIPDTKENVVFHINVTNKYWEEKENFAKEIITDRRWEKMQVYKTMGNYNNNFLEIASNLSENFVIPFSLRIKENAHFLLCDEKMYPDCYWLRIDAFKLNKFSVLKCSNKTLNGTVINKAAPTEECSTNLNNVRYKRFNIQYVSKDFWSNYIFEKNNRNLVLRRVNDNITMIEIVDVEININKLLINSYETKGWWRPHRIRYLYTTHKFQKENFSLPSFHTTKSYICISMIVKMCKFCNLAAVLLDSKGEEIYNEIHQGSGKWQEIKITADNNNEHVKLFVSTNSTFNEKVYWAFHPEVRQCQKLEYRMISSKVSKNCQLISPSGKNVVSNSSNISSNSFQLFNSNHCLEETVGNTFCVPCSWIHQSFCYKTKYYSFENDKVFYSCSTNYMGKDCDEQICSKRYNSKGFTCNIAPVPIFANPPNVTKRTSYGAVITVNFEFKGLTKNCMNSSYLIEYKNKGTDAWKIIDQDIPLFVEKQIKVTNLMSNTKYVVRSRFLCMDLKKSFNIPEKSFRTFDIPYLRPVENLTITQLLTNKFHLTWKPPKNVDINFPVDYIIECYKEDRKSSCLSESSNSSFKCTRQITNQTTLDLEVPHIEPFLFYWFNVTPMQHNFESTSLRRQKLTRPLDVIDEAEIYTLYVTNRTTSTIALEFNASNCSKVYGPLYIRTCNKCASDWCKKTSENCETKQLVSMEHINKTYSFTYSVLQQYTEYTVSYAFSRNATSWKTFQHNHSKIVRTLALVPNKVRDIYVYSEESSSISFRFHLPYPPTGVVSAYEIEYFCCGKNSAKVKINSPTPCVLWTEYECIKLSNLRSNQDYNITLRVKNANISRLSDPVIVVGSTKIKKPSPPLNMSLTWDSKNNLVIAWFHPNKTSGEQLKFQIQLIIHKEGNLLKKWNTYDVKIKEIELSKEEYNGSYQLKIHNSEIVPSVQYEVKITTNNSYYTSDPASATTFSPHLSLNKSNKPIESSLTIWWSIGSLIGVFLICCLFVINRKKIFRNRTRNTNETAYFPVAPGNSAFATANDEHFELNIQKSRILEKDFEQHVKKILQSGYILREHKSIIDNVKQNLYEVPKEKLFWDYLDLPLSMGVTKEKVYIVIEAPKADHFDEFWKVVWTENVRYLVSLGECSEINNCLSTDDVYSYIIEAKSNTSRDYYNETLLEVSYMYEKRKVVHFQMKLWKEDELPDSTLLFSQLLNNISNIPLQDNSPIMVLSQSSLTGSGFLIFIDMNLRNAKHDGSVNVKQCAEVLVNCDKRLLSDVKYFVFAHLQILENLMYKNTAVNTNSFDQKTKKLIEENAKKHLDHLKNVFRLDDMAKIVKMSFATSYVPMFIDVVESFDEQEYHYIDTLQNVEFNGYVNNKVFRAVEKPKRFSLDNFWNTIEKEDISVVVSFSSFQENECNWCPSKRNPDMFLTNLHIKHEETISFKSYFLNKVQLFKEKKKMSITIFIYKEKFQKNGCVKDLHRFVFFFTEIGKIIKKEQKPVLVTCADGKTVSGFLIGFYYLTESMEVENKCDVCSLVRFMKFTSKQFFRTQEQIQHLWDAVEIFLLESELYEIM